MNRMLIAAVVFVGVHLAGATVHLDRLHAHAHDLSATSGRLVVAAVVLAFATGFLASQRLLRGVATVSAPHELRAGALAAIYGALLLLGASWAPTLVVSVVAQLLAAAAIGACAGASLGVLIHRLGVLRTAAVGVVGLGGGVLLGVAGPVIQNALAEFGHLRAWRFERPETVPGMRATLLFGALAACVAAVQLGHAGRRIAAEKSNHAGGPVRAFRPPPAAMARRHPGQPLEIAGLDLSYGQLQVLFGVDLHVNEGETVALLGTNGAGKSSVLRAAFGLHPPSSGRVWSGDTDVTGWSAERLARERMLQVPGGKGVFPSLSVRENLRMAAYPVPGAGRVREGIDRAVSAFPRLAERLDQPAGVLSGGEQQMVALARAWIVRPKLLAIDELTLGLAPTVIGELLDFVRLLHAEGVPILIVEQSVHIAFELCERAYFLERGEVRFEGRTEDLMARDDLLRSIFFEGAERVVETTERRSR